MSYYCSVNFHDPRGFLTTNKNKLITYTINRPLTIQQLIEDAFAELRNDYEIYDITVDQVDLKQKPIYKNDYSNFINPKFDNDAEKCDESNFVNINVNEITYPTSLECENIIAPDNYTIYYHENNCFDQELLQFISRYPNMNAIKIRDGTIKNTCLQGLSHTGEVRDYRGAIQFDSGCDTSVLAWSYVSDLIGDEEVFDPLEHLTFCSSYQSNEALYMRSPYINLRLKGQKNFSQFRVLTCPEEEEGLFGKDLIRLGNLAVPQNSLKVRYNLLEKEDSKLLPKYASEKPIIQANNFQEKIEILEKKKGNYTFVYDIECQLNNNSNNQSIKQSNRVKNMISSLNDAEILKASNTISTWYSITTDVYQPIREHKQYKKTDNKRNNKLKSNPKKESDNDSDVYDFTKDKLDINEWSE